MAKGKIQHNKYGVNVLVESETSINRFIGNYKEVNIVGLSKGESVASFLEIFEKLTTDARAEVVKNFLKKQEGFAVSNCNDKKLGITYGDIVKYY